MSPIKSPLSLSGRTERKFPLSRCVCALRIRGLQPHVGKHVVWMAWPLLCVCRFALKPFCASLRGTRMLSFARTLSLGKTARPCFCQRLMMAAGAMCKQNFCVSFFCRRERIKWNADRCATTTTTRTLALCTRPVSVGGGRVEMRVCLKRGEQKPHNVLHIAQATWG